jgi:hypothetical protein
MIAPRSRELFPPDRLMAFSDGVFGVAITLLVIDVRLPPSSAARDDPALLHALLGMGPQTARLRIHLPRRRHALARTPSQVQLHPQS